MRHLRKFLAVAAVIAVCEPVLVAAQASPAVATANAQDARLTAFLDAEFAQEVKMRPQLATRLGLKENEDKLDDISDAAALKLLEWRRASVARMKAQFDRSKLSPAGQTNYDIWSTGNPKTDYYNLFIQDDLTSNKEAILPMVYIRNVLTQNLTRELGESSTGFTKDFARSFLCEDGLPTALSPLYKGDDSLDAEAANRDPRFSQLIATRGFVLTNNADGTKNIFSLPQIGTATAPTGYMIIKCLSPDPAQWNAAQSTLDLFIFRYAEVLLNEAEAKAELGQCTQAVLDNTINKLRDRVAMPHMVIASLVKDPNSTFPGLPVLLDEIRRERRIELAADGFRFNDLLRWNAGSLVNNPATILGMKLIPAIRAEYPPNQVSGVVVDANSYIRIYTNVNARTWNDKMYLYPIPTQELTLNPNLKPQNPGW